MSSKPLSTKSKWYVALGMLTLLIVLLAIILGFIGTLRNPSPAVHRIFLDCRAENVIGGPGESGARAQGEIVFDYNHDSSFTFDFRVLGTMSAVTALRIRGEKVLGTLTGPIVAALCGSPGTACDTTTNPGQVTGTVTQIQGASSLSVRVFIENFRDKPFLYYVEGLTNNKPTEPGAFRCEAGPIEGLK